MTDLKTPLNELWTISDFCAKRAQRKGGLWWRGSVHPVGCRHRRDQRGPQA